jgi:hypothetical protein
MAMTGMYLMQNFHKLYRRPRGMYFDATDKGEMVRMPAVFSSLACQFCCTIGC